MKSFAIGLTSFLHNGLGKNKASLANCAIMHFIQCIIICRNLSTIQDTKIRYACSSIPF